MAFTSIYPYEPSEALPIVFAVLAFVLGVVIFIQSWHYGWRHFNFMLTWATMVWTAGFVVREVSVHNQLNVDLYIAQYVLVFAAPPLFAASEYFILGRLLAYLPYHSPIHPGRVLSTFLLLSALVESLGASAAPTLVNSNSSPSARESALDRFKASLILQEVVEAGFIAMVALIEYRCRRKGTFPHNVKIMCRLLYITSLMMIVRCVIRTVEGFEVSDCPFGQSCGPVQTQEWILWVFEVANITILVSGLAIWHPGRYLPSCKTQYLDPRDGLTERVGPTFSSANSRPFIWTVLDPFDLAGRASKEGKVVNDYWNQDNPIADKSFATCQGWKMFGGKKSEAA